MEKIKKIQKSLRKQILERTALAYSLARSGHFALQSLPLPLIDLLATGKKRPFPDGAGDLKEALFKVKALHEKDLENIKNGVYPIDVLYPENPLRHAWRYPQLVIDTFKAARRRDKNDAKSFTPEADEYLGEMPAYYKRNFHFQTGGYLSEISAELYEHQVEVLFRGAADAMRRLILPSLKVHCQGSSGEGLHFLEIACGTGRLTRSMAYAFPKAKITCVDLSPVYLAKARERLGAFKNLNFVQSAAEDLPFKGEQFNAVVSCFLFHELPMDVRRSVIAESMRVLKPGGFVGLVDSIQKNDDAEFQWALKQFPLDFHEPFFKNYVGHPMEDLLTSCGLLNVASEPGLLSKAVSGVKGL